MKNINKRDALIFLFWFVTWVFLIVGWLLGETVFADDKIIPSQALQRIDFKILAAKIPVAEFLTSLIISFGVIVFFHKSKNARGRCVACFVGLLFPLIFSFLHKETPLVFLLSPIYTLQFVIGVLSSNLDAEFYADGMVIVAGLGFWQVTCIGFLIYEQLNTGSKNNCDEKYVSKM